jgi:3-phenylpropionate/trans-cinnamate dioxygenase ferredoxin subunit
MSRWLDAARVEDFETGRPVVLELEDTDVAVFVVDGQYYAVQDICTHDGETLTGGDVEGEEIECPRHGARFNIRTGKVTAPPAYEDLKTFPVRVHEDMVQVLVG